MKKPDKIEEVFQEAFKDYSVEPDPSLWAKIHSNIPTGGSGFSATAGNASLITKAVIGIAVVSGIGISAYYLTSEDQNNGAKDPNSEKIVPAISNEKTEENSLSIDILADTLEHLSNEVEKENIKEIEKILVEPKKATAKKITSDSEEKTKKVTPAEKITEITEENNDTDVEIGTSEDLSSQVDKSLEQKNTSTEINSEDSDNGPSVTENVDQEKTSSSNKPKEVISSEHRTEEIKINATIPNIFTPNQDGHNDVFRIDTKDADQVEVIIFDKSGKVLFEWQGLYGFWDGRLPNGEAAPSGNYFYQVRLMKDGKTETRKDMVLLKR